MGSLSVAPGYNDSLSMDTVSNWPSFKKWRAFRASNPYDPDWRAGLACGAPSDHLPDDRHWRRDARRRGRLQDEAQRDPHDDLGELIVAALLVAPATSSRKRLLGRSTSYALPSHACPTSTTAIRGRVRPLSKTGQGRYLRDTRL